MFREGQIVLSRLPHVYLSDGRYTVSFRIDTAADLAPPALDLIGDDPDRGLVTALLRPDILSLADAGGARRIALHPDGRATLRRDDTEVHDLPGRAGTQLSHGDTHVALGPEGEVIIVGRGFAYVIDAQGRLARPDDGGT